MMVVGKVQRLKSWKKHCSHPYNKNKARNTKSKSTTLLKPIRELILQATNYLKIKRKTKACREKQDSSICLPETDAAKSHKS